MKTKVKTVQEQLHEKLADPVEQVGSEADGEVIIDAVTDEPDEPLLTEEKEIEGEADPVQLVSKISVSTIGGDPDMAKRIKRRVPVAVMMGRASDIVLKDDPSGNGKVYKALVGAFHAINMQNGQQFGSGTCYLPEAFQNMVIATLEKQEDDRRHGIQAFRAVEFAYRVDAEPQGNPRGYSYVMRSMLPASPASDPLRTLKLRTAKILKADNFDVPMLGSPKVIEHTP